MSECSTLARERRIKREHGEKMVDITVKEAKFQGGEEGTYVHHIPMEI